MNAYLMSRLLQLCICSTYPPTTRSSRLAFSSQQRRPFLRGVSPALVHVPHPLTFFLVSSSEQLLEQSSLESQALFKRELEGCESVSANYTSSHLTYIR